MKDAEARRTKLAAALKNVAEVDAKQKAKGLAVRNGPAVPTTDVDAGVLKNKTGGFAPNYLVVFATEGKNGLIMDYQVPGGGDEPGTVLPAIENLKASFGTDPAETTKSAAEKSEAEPVESVGPENPAEITAAVEPATGEAVTGEAVTGEETGDPTVVRHLLADTGFNTGRNLDGLADAGVTPWMPARVTGVVEDVPAANVPAADVPAAPGASGAGQSMTTVSLPINVQTKLIDRSAFVYDKTADAYTCPAGRSLPLLQPDKTEQTRDGPVTYSVYGSRDCSGCRLSCKCLGKTGRPRTLRRDRHDPLREQMAARLATDAGKAGYRRRSHLPETPFAVPNTTMNVRQLLLRGIDKVRTEIGRIATAYNLKKMAALLVRHRQQAAAA